MASSMLSFGWAEDDSGWLGQNKRPTLNSMIEIRLKDRYEEQRHDFGFSRSNLKLSLTTENSPGPKTT